MPPVMPTKAMAITPSDTTELSLIGVYVGGAGNVALQFEGDSAAVTFTAPPVGTILWGNIRRVFSAGTTATVLVGLRR